MYAIRSYYDIHVVVELSAAGCGRFEAVEPREEQAVGVAHPLNLQRLRMPVEMPGGDRPGGEVAEVDHGKPQQRTKG